MSLLKPPREKTRGGGGDGEPPELKGKNQKGLHKAGHQHDQKGKLGVNQIFGVSYLPV